MDLDYAKMRELLAKVNGTLAALSVSNAFGLPDNTATRQERDGAIRDLTEVIQLLTVVK